MKGKKRRKKKGCQCGMRASLGVVVGWRKNKKEKRFSKGFFFVFDISEARREAKRREKNQEKCENKAISWIKWDVTGGKTVMYAFALSRSFAVFFFCYPEEAAAKKRVNDVVEVKKENYISKIRGWNGWCSYLGAVRPLFFCWGVDRKCVQI